MRWSRRLLVVLFLGGLCCLTAQGDEKTDREKNEFANLGDLNAEVTVLNVLYTLDPTAAQMEAFRKAASKTMQKPPPRKLIKVSEKLRKTMLSLRNALASGDDEKIGDLFDQYDKLREKEEPEFEDVEITEKAREVAPELFRLLSARQMANYIASVPEFPDPVEQLVETMAQGRRLRGAEWQALRDDTAHQVGWLIAGLDARREERTRDQATALLNRAYKLTDKDYEGRREQLEKEARDLVGKLTAVDILRNFMERVLAEALSSHRFEAALSARERKK